MRIWLALALLLVMAPECGAQAVFAPGQVWSYAARPGEEQSTLTILRVESLSNLGLVVHVRLDGLQMKVPSAPGGRASTVAHAPFAAAAVQRSVARMLSDGVLLPPYETGYESWRQAQGGVFTVEVAKAVAMIEKMLSQ